MGRWGDGRRDLSIDINFVTLTNTCKNYLNQFKTRYLHGYATTLLMHLVVC